MAKGDHKTNEIYLFRAVASMLLSAGVQVRPEMTLDEAEALDGYYSFSFEGDPLILMPMYSASTDAIRKHGAELAIQELLEKESGLFEIGETSLRVRKQKEILDEIIEIADDFEIDLNSMSI